MKSGNLLYYWRELHDHCCFYSLTKERWLKAVFSFVILPPIFDCPISCRAIILNCPLFQCKTYTPGMCLLWLAAGSRQPFLLSGLLAWRLKHPMHESALPLKRPPCSNGSCKRRAQARRVTHSKTQQDIIRTQWRSITATRQPCNSREVGSWGVGRGSCEGMVQFSRGREFSKEKKKKKKIRPRAIQAVLVLPWVFARLNRLKNTCGEMYNPETALASCYTHRGMGIVGAKVCLARGWMRHGFMVAARLYGCMGVVDTPPA